MRERPILFSAPMVQAILAGNKTMTRRVMNPQPVNMPNGAYIDPYNKRYDRFTAWTQDNKMLLSCGGNIKDTAHWKCQYGKPGDLLWVRETFGVAWNSGAFIDPCVNYKATLERIPIAKDITMKRWQNLYLEPGRKPWQPDKWRPSIYMPKWACRIWLKVKSIRVEYLNAITRDDIVKEGICQKTDKNFMDPWITLWDSINAGRGHSWESNPWVWVVEFERTEKPTDL